MKGEKKKKKGWKVEEKREENNKKYIYNHFIFPPREAVTKWYGCTNSVLAAWLFGEEGVAHLSHCRAELDRLGAGSSSGKGIVLGSCQQFYVSFISLPLFQNGILYMIVSCQLILLFCRLNRLRCQYSLLLGWPIKDYWETRATFHEGLNSYYLDNVIPPQILLVTEVEQVCLFFHRYCWGTVYFVKAHDFMGH